VRHREEPADPVLDGVDVLVLVDEDLLELPAVVFENLRHLLEEAHCQEEEVVEIHAVALAEPFRVLLEDVAENLAAANLRKPTCEKAFPCSSGG